MAECLTGSEIAAVADIFTTDSELLSKSESESSYDVSVTDGATDNELITECKKKVTLTIRLLTGTLDTGVKNVYLLVDGWEYYWERGQSTHVWHKQFTYDGKPITVIIGDCWADIESPYNSTWNYEFHLFYEDNPTVTIGKATIASGEAATLYGQSSTILVSSEGGTLGFGIRAVSIAR